MRLRVALDIAQPRLEQSHKIRQKPFPQINIHPSLHHNNPYKWNLLIYMNVLNEKYYPLKKEKKRKKLQNTLTGEGIF